MKFEDFRKEYPRFIYNNYKISETNKNICIEYDFEIEKLTKFNPKIEILKKEFKIRNINLAKVKNMVFNLGLV